MPQYKTQNALIAAVALRAKELTDKKMDELRDIFGEDESRSARRDQCLGMTKGDLVEAILLDEFCEEFDYDIVAD